MSTTIATSLAFVLLLFLGMLFMIEIGWRIGNADKQKSGLNGESGWGVVDAAMFGLMGLLVAFSFSGAAQRFDHRKQLAGEEANAIGTAYMRLSLLRDSDRSSLNADFKRYVRSRIAMYRAVPDMTAVNEEYSRTVTIQSEIWAKAVSSTDEQTKQAASMLLLPALNLMFDITTTRRVAAMVHPPLIIFLMLGVVALTCSLLAGYDMAIGGKRSRIHIGGFSLILALTVYVILDLEFPRLGMIRVDDVDRMLVEIEESFN